MAYLKAEIVMTFGARASRSFVSCSLFQMGYFVVAYVAWFLCNSRASWYNRALVIQQHRVWQTDRQTDTHRRMMTAYTALA